MFTNYHGMKSIRHELIATEKASSADRAIYELFTCAFTNAKTLTILKLVKHPKFQEAKVIIIFNAAET